MNIGFGTKKNSKIHLQKAIYLSIALPFLAVFGLGSVSLSSKAGSCGICHSKHVQSWRSCAHRDVSCTSCHEKPAWMRFSGLGCSSGANQIVSTATCTTCHSKMPNTVTYHGNKMPHKEHIQSQLACIKCHSGIGHGKGAIAQIDMTSAECARCHLKAEKAHTAVVACVGPMVTQVETPKELPVRAKHVKDGVLALFCTRATQIKDEPKRKEPNNEPSKNVAKSVDKPSKPDSHNQADWLKIHGQTEDKTSCQTCHGKENTCSSCHGGVQMPHPDGWIMNHKEHGASFDQTSSCFKCHDKKKYCGRCHQVNVQK